MYRVVARRAAGLADAAPRVSRMCPWGCRPPAVCRFLRHGDHNDGKGRPDGYFYAGEFDPDILGVAAEFGSPIVLMHMAPETPDQPARGHPDICTHVFDYLVQRAHAAMDAGIRADRIILDPGIGFGKTDADNWKLLAGIDRLVARRFPVLIGVSRKRFLAGLLPPNATLTEIPASGWSARDTVTALTTLLTAQRGVRIHRVHDVSLAACALAALAAVHNP